MKLIIRILSLVLSLSVFALGGCTTTAQLRDGTEIDMNTVFNLNHAHSLVTRWQKTDRLDATGQPVWVQYREEKVLGADQAGRPVIARVASEDKISGPSVIGQMAGSAVAGTGAAIINGDTARSVAEKGKCPAGALACGGNIFQNQVQSVAEALNKNDNNLRIGAGTAVPACARTTPSTCGN